MANTPYVVSETVNPSAAITSVATTSATSTSPYGFTTAAQADAIVTSVNSMIAALRKAGIILT